MSLPTSLIGHITCFAAVSVRLTVDKIATRHDDGLEHDLRRLDKVENPFLCLHVMPERIGMVTRRHFGS